MAKRRTKAAKPRTAKKKGRAKAGRKAAKRPVAKKAKRRSAAKPARKRPKVKAKPSASGKPKAKRAASKKKVRAKRTTATKVKAKRTTAKKTKTVAKKVAKAEASAAKKASPTVPPAAGSAPPGPTLVGGLKIVDDSVPLPKTRLSPDQLAEFRQKLLQKRRDLVGDVDNLTSEALRRSRQEAAGDLSSMPIHMADIGSDNWEQEFTLGLISNERTLLKEIDEALRRIDDGTYGVCLATHRPIIVARLRAKPWAKYCIEYARLREQGRMP